MPTLTAEAGLLNVSGRVDGQNGTEWTGRLSPGFRWTLHGRQAQAQVFYEGSAVYRSGQQGSHAEWRNRLGSDLKAEIIDRRLTLSAHADVSQQAISALGTPVNEGTQGWDNRAEVARLFVSPQWRSRVGDWGVFDATWSSAISRSRHSALADSTAHNFVIGLGSQPGVRLGWRGFAERQILDYSGSVQASDIDRVGLEVFYLPDDAWRVSGRLGHEQSRIGSLAQRDYDNYGAGVTWTPSRRTSVSASAEKRYFGNSHQVSAQHRWSRSAVHFSDQRSLTNAAANAGGNQPVTLQQLYEFLFSSITDPADRTAAVNAAIAAQPGARADQLVSLGALAGGISTQRRQELGYIYQGPRMTWNVTAFRNEIRRTDDGLLLALGGSSDFDQQGWIARLSHRVTAATTASMMLSEQSTLSLGTSQEVRLRSATLQLTSQVARRASASAALRWSSFRSPTAPYRETGLTGTLNLQF